MSPPVPAPEVHQAKIAQAMAGLASFETENMRWVRLAAARLRQTEDRR